MAQLNGDDKKKTNDDFWKQTEVLETERSETFSILRKGVIY